MEELIICVAPCPGDLDDDGDGLPDEWEEAHGFDPLALTDSSTDEDSDGLTRLEESEKNTNPGVDDTDSDGVTSTVTRPRGAPP